MAQMLSSKLLIIGGKLTYAAYLTHMIVIKMFYGVAHEPIRLSFFQIVGQEHLEIPNC